MTLQPHSPRSQLHLLIRILTKQNSLFPHRTKPSLPLASWNLHKPLPRSQTASPFSLYGPPGPPPISTGHPRTQVITKPNKSTLSVSIGDKLPHVMLSYLNRNDIAKSVTLPSLCKAKKVVLVGVRAPFPPNCTRFVKRVKSARQKGADLIACVAVSDVFVMRARGESLAMDERVLMLSDGLGELTRTLGMSLNPTSKAYLGLGVGSSRFCLAAFNGVVTSVDFDKEQADDALVSTK